jgi:hypothetical protein
LTNCAFGTLAAVWSLAAWEVVAGGRVPQFWSLTAGTLAAVIGLWAVRLPGQSPEPGEDSWKLRLGAGYTVLAALVGSALVVLAELLLNR